MKNSKAQFYNIEQKSKQTDEIPDISGFEKQQLGNSEGGIHEANNNQIQSQREMSVQDLQFLASEQQWKKANEIMNGELTLFGKIHPSDVIQGSLKDQTFLCVLASMAKNPINIKKLFKNTDLSKNGNIGIYLGMYCIKIFGEEIIVDDSFPIDAQNNFKYAKPVENKLWVMLLEKAYAKYYGSYASIQGGSPRSAIRDLTLAANRAELINNLNPQELWEMLEKSLKNNYLLLISSNNFSEEKNEKEQVIFITDCYSILDIKRNEDLQLIQLRNCLGSSDLKLDLKLKSDQFSFEQQQADDPGRFWMTLKYFQEQFCYLTIGQIGENYKQLIRTLNFDQKEPITIILLQITFSQKTNAQIGMTQNSKDFRYGSTEIRLIIGKLHQKTKQVMGFIEGCHNTDAYIQREFQVGDYVIYAEVDWVQEQNRSLTVSYYGDQNVDISEFQISKEKYKLYSQNIFEGLIRAHASLQESIKYYKKDIYRVSGSLAGYDYFLYSNKTNNTQLFEKISIFLSKNIEICPPFNSANEIFVQCKPQSNSLVKLRTTKEGYGRSFFKSKLSFSLIQSRSDEDIIKQALLRPDEKQKIVGSNQSEAIFYQVIFRDGFAFVFENEESKIFLKTLRFSSENIKGINFDFSSQIIEVEVPPKQCKVLQFTKIDPFSNYSFDWIQEVQQLELEIK